MIGTRFGTADTLDVLAVGVRYRAFLLRSSLQVDVSFWPHDHFRATEPAFQLLFGAPNPPTKPAPLNTDTAIGMAWLYALHARSATARDKLWQASMMLDELRNRIIDLKCSRAGLNSWHGREVDQLAATELEQLAATRAVDLTPEDLYASRLLLVELLLNEVALIDPSRAARLEPALAELGRPAR